MTLYGQLNSVCPDYAKCTASRYISIPLYKNLYLGVAFLLVHFLGVYAIVIATMLQYLATNMTKVHVVNKKLAELE